MGHHGILGRRVGTWNDFKVLDSPAEGLSKEESPGKPLPSLPYPHYRTGDLCPAIFKAPATLVLACYSQASRLFDRARLLGCDYHSELCAI